LHIGSYRTAWYLNHRIRKAMEDEPSGPLKGVVEADETYIGGKYDKRRKRGKYDKEPVFGVVERGGEVRTWHIPIANRVNLYSRLRDSVEVESTLYTDCRRRRETAPFLAVSDGASGASTESPIGGDAVGTLQQTLHPAFAAECLFSSEVNPLSNF
jgi:hypothetical protein